MTTRIQYATLAAALAFGLLHGAPTASFAKIDHSDIAWHQDSLQNGKRDLGRDISGVPATEIGVWSYLQSLNPDAQRFMIGGCRTALSYPAQVHARDIVIPFCEIAVRSSIASMPAGHGG